MSNPVIANNLPLEVNLTAGEDYYFCACGHSKNQPFCDGSHAETDILPIPFKAEETGSAYLCRCKHTGNAPYCDGTHSQYTEADIGKEVPLS
jgi:CDGSH-type Zn-finger protein